MYQFAAGHDNASSLADINPQPRTPAIVPGRLTLSLDAKEFADGYDSVDLIFSSLKKGQFSDLLTQFGLSWTNRSAECTIRVKVNEDRDYANFNATIYYPEDISYQNWWTDVVFKVRRLTEI